MYCGDETAGLVGDFGTNSFKIGFAGEDTPRRDIPSVVGYCRAQKSETLGMLFNPRNHLEYEALSLDEKNEATPQNSNGTDNGVKPSTTETPNVESKTSNISPTLTPKKKPDPKVVFDFMTLKASCRETEIARPMRNGMYEKFDLIESMWEHAITHELSCKPEEHPLLICDPSFNTLQNREKLLETMFEKLRSPLLYVAPNAVGLPLICKLIALFCLFRNYSLILFVNSPPVIALDVTFALDAQCLFRWESNCIGSRRWG